MPKTFIPPTLAGPAIISFIFLFASAGVPLAQSPQPNENPQAIEFFEKRIRPVLVERCYQCHSSQAPAVQGGLLLDTREGLRKGGNSGAALVPGNPEQGLLIKALRYKNKELQMPPGEPLTAERVADFETWVTMGAPDPRIAKPAKPLGTASSHWSFQQPRKAALPAIRNQAWAQNPIDAFILSALEAKGLQPSAPADKRTLLRRVTYDLIGLPPTPQETEAFLADQTPQAFARVVDRLLASPHYGERWGRHWLDVARYADTKSGGGRFPFAYTYRDWVVQAFNDDMPYDQFLSWQIAADRLLKHSDPPLDKAGIKGGSASGDKRRHLAALGFITLGRDFPGSPHEMIDDRIDVVTRGTLALTVSCARCHDHKYDPISTKDYYSLYGIFANASEPPALPLLGKPTAATPRDLYYDLGLRERRDAIREYRAFLCVSASLRRAFLLEAKPVNPIFTRRELLSRCGMGMGALALTQLIKQAGLLQAAETKSFANPLAPKPPHFQGKAKRVIHLFMNGGPSHVDTFDPKPMLQKYAGKALPFTLRTERKTGAAFPSPFEFKRFGKSGIEVSEIFSHVGECIDDICVIRSMNSDIPNHEPSLMMMNCGDVRQVRPCFGSWITYGLGSENQNLPGFVVLCPNGMPTQGTQNWRSAFLPGAFQGTRIDTKETEVDKLIEYIKNRSTSPVEQRCQLDLLARLNQNYQQPRQEDALLESRIQSFELAYRMQMEADDAFDLSREPVHILKMYGSGLQARQMLIARRLLEKGVRFVQVWHGESQPWDNHNDIATQHRQLAQECDQPIAALLKDLKQRGMLEDTLVIWGGEFGRTPTVELPDDGANLGKVNGRDHNPYGFSMWVAGGGVRGGTVHGATDEFGFAAAENKVHVHDLHATLLHLLGFDHEKFTYRYAGRDFRLTDVHGRVVKEILA